MGVLKSKYNTSKTDTFSGKHYSSSVKEKRQSQPAARNCPHNEQPKGTNNFSTKHRRWSHYVTPMFGAKKAGTKTLWCLEI